MRVQVAQQAQEILGTSDLVIITERGDDVALLIGQMVKTGLPEVLDRHIPHSRWVATRRGLDKPVSSSPPFQTGRAPLRASGLTPLINLHGDHEASGPISPVPQVSTYVQLARSLGTLVSISSESRGVRMPRSSS